MIPRTITTPASIVFDFIRIDTFGNWGLEYFNLLVVCFYIKKYGRVAMYTTR